MTGALALAILQTSFLHMAPREPGVRVTMRLDNLAVEVLRTAEGIDSVVITSPAGVPVRIVSSAGVPVAVILRAQPAAPPPPAPRPAIAAPPPWREPFIVGEIYGGFKFYRWADYNPKWNVGGRLTFYFPAYYAGLQPSLHLAADRDVSLLSAWVASLYAQVQIFKF